MPITYTLDLVAGTLLPRPPQGRGGRFRSYKTEFATAIREAVGRTLERLESDAAFAYPFLREPVVGFDRSSYPTIRFGLASADELVHIIDKGSRPHTPPAGVGSRLWRWVQRSRGDDPDAVLAAIEAHQANLAAWRAVAARNKGATRHRRTANPRPVGGRTGASAYPVARAIEARGTLGKHRLDAIWAAGQADFARWIVRYIDELVLQEI